MYFKCYTQNAYIMHYYGDCICSHQGTNTSIQRRVGETFIKIICCHTHGDTSHQHDGPLWRYPLSEDEKPSCDLIGAYSPQCIKLFIVLLFQTSFCFVCFFLLLFSRAGFWKGFCRCSGSALAETCKRSCLLSLLQAWQRRRQQLPTQPSRRPWRSRRSSWRRWAATTATPTTTGATERTETSAPALVRTHTHTVTNTNT